MFDERYYLNNYPDVIKADMDPLWHFVCLGWKERRNPSKSFNTNFYLSMNNDVKQSGINPLIHFIKFGKKEDRRPNLLLYKENLVKKSSKNNRKKQEEVTLYLHIGQNKTGTSAIQTFLDLNRQFLFLELGYLYPNFEVEDLISGNCINHTVWNQKVSKDDKKLISDFERIMDFSHRFNINKVVISNEGYFLNNEVIEISKKLIENKFPMKIKPICYLRRIDHWVESAWKQWGIKQYDSFDKFINQPEHFQLFERACKHFAMWNEIIDIENIIVRPYEKQQLPHGLLHDFLSLIGIEYNAYKWQKEEKSVNIGFNRDVVEVLHLCRDLFVDVHDNHLFNLFAELLGDDFQKKPFETYDLLSPQNRWELINQNLPFEEEIAKIFMGRENGRIFSEPIPNPDEVWEPYKGLTLEKTIPIIIKMIDAINK